MARTSLAVSILFAAHTLAQVAVWGQCGGIGYTGSPACISGNTCVKLNDWYSQCQPGGPITTLITTTSQPVTTDSSITTAQEGTTTSSQSGSGSNPSTCAAVPSSVTLTTISALPDPFKFISGTRVSSKDQFACRQKEINQLFQTYELGAKPGTPQSVTATYSGSSLSITVSDNGKSISFSVSISKPSGSGPFPAIIAYGAASIPIPAGVATIIFNNDDIAAQQSSSSRGQGKFYTLYGSGHSAGALMAWAWGVSRIIDAIEKTQSTGIDPKKIGVTGCSRNGKGAIVAGAFDERVALTIPQESGSGGAACWRLSDYQKSQGQNVQTASEIVGENVWFSKNFEQFSNSVPRLPVDHHELAGLVAPRGLFVIENTSMEWLGALSTYRCMQSGRMIYQALGITDSMGYSQVGNHNHCQFPSSQQPELQAFIDRFLLSRSANTNIFKTDGNLPWDQSKFIDWTVPTLS